MAGMRRRDFIAAAGSTAVAWPLAVRAQQPAMPVIGFLAGQSRQGRAYLTAALKQGLSETGYIEGQNTGIEYRWAENQNNRLPELAVELLARKVAVIVAGPLPAALAAKAATADIPIVFAIGGDPVKGGLVASLNRPDGNVTGVSFFTTTLEPKRLELLQEVSPNVAVIGMLLNPKSLDYENQVRDVQTAARSIGQQIVILNASSEHDIENAFATIVQQRVGAVLIGSDPFFTDQRNQLVALAAFHGVPAIYQWREFTEAGGLMSYGTSLTDAYRNVGIYVGRILKGTKSADLPVQQSTKVELVINLKTARALGLTFPLPLSGRADEVIE
jgi:putative ABC transport system substrate-binding protein